MRLPSDIGPASRGERVQEIALAGATVEAGVGTQGHVASLAGASAALPGGSTAAAADRAAEGLTESPAACLFTPPQLARSLEFTVALGRGPKVA